VPAAPENEQAEHDQPDCLQQNQADERELHAADRLDLQRHML